MTITLFKTGINGISLIKKFEGLRLDKYQDAVGKWTIGYGHLILSSEKYDLPITEAEADKILMNDLNDSECGVHESVTAELNQNQFDALVSFTFNLGVGDLKRSTLLKLLNQSDYADAANEFLAWDKAGGNVLPGLLRRRTAERLLFLTPTDKPFSF